MLDVFVRGADDRLWTRSFDGTGQGWSVWELVPGGLALTSAPAAVRWGPGQIDVFARGPNDALWHTWRENGAWSGRWESLGGVLTSAPTVASWEPGRLDVFVRGSDNRLHQRSCEIKLSLNSICDGSDWSGWQAPPVGGGDLGSAPAAVSWGIRGIDVFTRGTDSNTYHAWFDGGSWGPGWVPLGGQTYEAPAVASREAGRLYLFVRGTDGNLYRQKYANGGWDGQWEGRGGRNARFKGTPAAVTATVKNEGCGISNDHRWLHVFLRGGGSGELHHLRDCPN